MILTHEVKAAELAELLKQIQAGNEIVVTQDQKPVAKLISTALEKDKTKPVWKLHGIKGHRVLKPDFTHAEIADEMFGPR